MFGRKKSPAKLSGRVDTLVGAGAKIAGDISFGGGLHLDGRIVGNVRTEQNAPSTLWVSEQGTIEGLVEVPNIVLNGTVIGDIHARERLVMGVKARVLGNVYYGAIEMAQGAEVSGKMVPTSASPAGATPAALTGPTATAPSKGLSREAFAEAQLVDSVLGARRVGS